MSAGFLTLYSKGIVFECISPPPKISDSLKGHFDTLTSYGAWEAGGIVGLAAKYSFLAIKDSIKDSKKLSTEELDEPSIEDLFSFYIPIINIISVEKIKISKGRLGLNQVKAMKILTKSIDDKENIFWLSTSHPNPADVIFKLRFEEEKRLGVKNNELAKFN